MRPKTILAICIVLVSGNGFAYQEPVHEEFSKTAFDLSGLAVDPSLAQHLGIAPTQTFPNSNRITQSIPNLMRFGARLEDSGDRSVNHFYDPMRDRALTIAGFSWTFEKSPDWAVDGVDQPEDANYSYAALLDRMARALTAATETERLDNWGLTFQGLGHVVHHIQDMAQPQHVRNDAHLDTSELNVIQQYVLAPFKDPSLYERYTTATAPKWAPLLGAGYSPRGMTQARAHWHTTDARGLADFTNRNFVSKDSNFEMRDGQLAANATYSRPVPTDSSLVDIEQLGIADAAALCERLKQAAGARASGVRCVIEFIHSTVVDSVTGESVENERAASLSVFDQAMEEVAEGPFDRVFTLNRFNFDAAHAFLIPRAVGYSTSLIDHFFRGRVRVATSVVRDGQVTLGIENASTDGNDFGAGDFAVHYDSTDGTRKPLTQSASAHLAVGAVHDLSFALPADLDLKADNPFVIVFRGVIGGEHGVSGLVFDLPDAYQGFTFTAQLLDRQGSPHLLHKAGGAWTLYPQGGLPEGGNVDWKGWYEGGTPTRMLTWHGFRHGIKVGTVFASGGTVYEGGKAFVIAPCDVLGAALQKGAEARGWVVVVCESKALDQDIVMKRPAKKSRSTALYHPETSPDGWRVLGRFPRPSHLSADRESWQFNGSGTEAQTMRAVVGTLPASQRPYSRLKMTVAGDVATFEEMGNTRVVETETHETVASKTVDGQTYDYCQRSGTVARDWSVSTTGRPVVAVDYLDGQEVLAYLDASSSTVGTERGVAGKHYDSRYTTTTRWVLEVGSGRHELWREDDSYTLQVSQSPYEQTVLGLYNDMRASVVALDLRSGHVLLRRREIELRKATDSPTSIGAGTRSISRRASYALSGPVTVASGNMDLHQEHWQVYLDAGSATRQCDDGGIVRTLSSTSTRQFDVNLFSVQDANPDEVQAAVSAAVDRAGSVFLSVRHIDLYTKKPHFFSHLTGADPVSLTGIDPAAPYFERIRPR